MNGENRSHCDLWSKRVGFDLARGTHKYLSTSILFYTQSGSLKLPVRSLCRSKLPKKNTAPRSRPSTAVRETGLKKYVAIKSTAKRLLHDHATPPLRRNKWQRQRMRVHFADTAQLHIFEERYKDNNGRSVAPQPQELWYTSAEYDRMKHAVTEAVFEIRRRQMAMVNAPSHSHDENEGAHLPFQAEAEEGDGLSNSNSDCIGIEHLLTRASILEVMTCRARCVEAVLEEQARQMQMTDQSPSTSLRLEFGWNAVALSSLTQTRRTMLRAQILGRLHRESI